ncbi:MAG TPA: saccharopine dehydrogenase NADP-binding domain-containing protein [Cyclobacteriaceae bacterium]|nr:saccharopine dehydrogenase NADP-binding domain-containing protein [Cyclobacteriaceae bacterium]
MHKILVYGSYGYTGQLIVHECKRKNLQVILAGRNAEALKKQSETSAYPYEVFSTDETEKLEQVLSKVSVVIHCGGPFRHTAKAMIQACIKTKTHYTDITGEYEVFEMARTYDAQAKAAGIQIMPGTGFDVVPSDCLALHLKKQLPDATHLQLAFISSGGGLSRGTSKTMIEGMGYGGMIRKDGKLIRIKSGEKVMEIDFGTVKSKVVSIPWGDISTAYFSTGIPNIEVYTGVPDKLIKQLRRSNYINWLLRASWIKTFLKKKIEKKKAGPSAEHLVKGKSFLWGKVWNTENKSVEAKLETLNGYALTAQASVLIAEKILAGNFKAGYQTPASAYGIELILEIPPGKWLLA